MKLHVLFGLRKESYDGEFGPEVLLAWDEFWVDENPDGFEEAVEYAKREQGDVFYALRVIDLEVSQDKIRSLLVPNVPVVTASVVESGA